MSFFLFSRRLIFPRFRPSWRPPSAPRLPSRRFFLTKPAALGGSGAGQNSENKENRDSNNESDNDSSSSSVFSSFLSVGRFLLFLQLFRTFCFDLMSCQGPSMLPTLHESGDIVLIDNFSLQISPLFYAAQARLLNFLYGGSRKGGEWSGMEFDENGKLQRYWGIERGEIVYAISKINPAQKVCKRVIGLPGDFLGFQSVPPGHFWLQGDNMANSADSRAYGPVPVPLVHGRIIGRVFPFGEAGRFEVTLKFAKLPESPGSPAWLE